MSAPSLTQQETSRDRRTDLGALLAGACALLVAASAAFKAGCIDASKNFSHTCYSDVLELFTSRDVAAGRFPYVHGRLEGGAPVDTYEYPVLTGVFVWFTGLFADDRAQFLLVSTLFLAPFAVLVAVLLHRMTGVRAAFWACAPALVLYALHNWDLLAVAAAVGGLYLWSRDRPVLAALLLGTGGMLKLYPALFLLPLCLDLLTRGRVRTTVAAAATGVAAVVLPNVPFALVDLDGWLTTYRFQQARRADETSNSVWYWANDALRLETPELNRLIVVLLALVVVLVTVVGLVRWRREGAFPVLQVSGALLCAFMLLNKVASPQYTLWLLPFFALLRVRWGWWAAFQVADLLVYVGIFRWLTALQRGMDFGLAKQSLIVGVWTKSALLVVLFVLLLRAKDALAAQPVQRPLVNVSTSSAMSGAQTAT